VEDNILQLVFTSVILGMMTYAISAWWGYATAADHQRLEAFIRRVVYALVCSLYPADGPNLHQLVSDGNDVAYSLHEYWRMNIISLYCDNCYQILPLMDYAVEGTAYNTLNIYGIRRLLYKDMYRLTHFSLL